MDDDTLRETIHTVRETDMPDIVETWRGKLGFALFAAAFFILPGGLLLALAGRPGALAFAGVCFCGCIVAAHREEMARHRRSAP